MTLFGITGGIGMGKSTAGDLLLRANHSLIDTDVIARQVVAPGQAGLDEIRAAFGSHLISEAGELRRDELARIVFNDPNARKQLEAILHPRIRDIWQAEVERWRAQGLRYGFVIIPLLFETDASRWFDAVVCVACSTGTQLERLRKRNWDDSQIHNRLAAQWSIDRKIAASNFVVWTDTSLEAHEAQLKRILQTVC